MAKWLTRLRSSVKATVNWTGAGVFGGTARTTSDPVALFVVANPQPAGELPQPLDISLQHFSNDLGVSQTSRSEPRLRNLTGCMLAQGIGIGFASPYLTVASLVNVRFTLLGAPSNISIKSIESFITQEYALSVHGNTKVVRPPPQTHKLSKIDKLRASQVLSVAICTNDCSAPLPRFDISGRLLEDPLPPRICSHCDEDHNAPVTSPTPPCCPPHGDAELIEHDPYPLVSELKAGTPFNFSRTFRVPNDDYIRGTTMEDTDTRIRVSHKLSVEVRYQVAGEQDDKLFTLSKPVSIASCCCFADSLYLPAYTRSAPKTIVRPLHSRCYCNFSLKEMVDRDGLALQRAGEIDAPTAGARLLGAERLSKSAACSMGLETRSPSFDSRMTSSASSVVSEAGPSTPLDELQGPCLPALKLEASAG